MSSISFSFFYSSFPPPHPFFVSTCVYLQEYFGCMTFSFYFNFYFPIILNGCAFRQLPESRIRINWIVLYVGIPLSNTCNNLVMIICLVTIVNDKCLISTKHDCFFSVIENQMSELLFRIHLLKQKLMKFNLMEQTCKFSFLAKGSEWNLHHFFV